jgi:hypothetical protein
MRWAVHFCYVDESGSADLLTRTVCERTPVFVLAGVTVTEARQKDLIWDFLTLKKRFEPRLQSVKLTDLIKAEIKGQNLRKDTGRRAGRGTAVVEPSGSSTRLFGSSRSTSVS